jgi:hypothetical protein
MTISRELRKLSQYTDEVMGWIIQSLNPSRDKRVFSSPKHPDWLWDPNNIICSEYREFLSWV